MSSIRGPNLAPQDPQQFQSPAFKPILLSTLIDWCGRVQKDYQIKRKCLKSHENEALWQEEIENGCPFCTLLHEAVWKLYSTYFRKGGKIRRIDQVPASSPWICDEGGNSIYFFSPNSDLLNHRLKDLSFLPPRSRIPPKLEIPRNTSSETTLQTVNGWLHDCTSNHPLCGENKEVRLPTRVIVVGSADSEPYLLETAGAWGRYTALSHPWGKRPLVRTLKENIHQFKVKFSWQDIPQTFRDAIDFTRRLGLNYIWIDSLCIVQDDPLDWQREAAQMASIYQHAYATLTASKAIDSSRGLYTSYLDPPLPTQRLSLIDDVDNSDLELHAISDLEHVGDGASPSFPIKSRAWVYQERLLSARVIHFAGSEVNWECRSARICECQRDLATSFLPEKPQFAYSVAEVNKEHHSSNDIDDLSKSPYYSEMIRSRRWTKSADTWRQIVQTYCHLKLTYPKDKFPALSGIAKVWNPQYETQYLAGLWRESLHLDLLWLVYQPEKRAEPWRAPTWSWASLEYGRLELIRFDSDTKARNSGKGSWLGASVIGSEDCAGVAEVLEAVCVPAGIDSSAELSSAHLSLSTFVLPGYLVSRPSIYPGNIDLIVGDLRIPSGHTYTRGLHLDADIPDISSNAISAIPVQVIRITDFGVKGCKCPEMACLVVRQKELTTPLGEVQYERICYVRFMDIKYSRGLPSFEKEQLDNSPSMEGWLASYEKETETIKKERSSSDDSDLIWLRRRFEKAGRQTIKLV